MPLGVSTTRKEVEEIGEIGNVSWCGLQALMYGNQRLRDLGKSRLPSPGRYASTPTVT